LFRKGAHAMWIRQRFEKPFQQRLADFIGAASSRLSCFQQGGNETICAIRSTRRGPLQLSTVGQTRRDCGRQRSSSYPSILFVRMTINSLPRPNDASAGRPHRPAGFRAFGIAPR
jgi:hypothetical protein